MSLPTHSQLFRKIPLSLNNIEIITKLMETRVTVEIDHRGRFTIPGPARRVLSISGKKAKVSIQIRILKPDNLRNNQATDKPEVDERGRATIDADVREDLGIKSGTEGIESIAEIAVSKPSGATA